MRDPKSKMNSRVEEDVSAYVPKPGLQTSLPHISMMRNHSTDMQVELTRHLKPHLATRLGVRRGRNY
jgi:hypothetical protein